MLYEYIEEIQRLRKEKKISYDELSCELGIGYNTITGFMNGKTIINAEYFLMICDYVGLDLWQKGTVERLASEAVKHDNLSKVYAKRGDSVESKQEMAIKKAYTDAISIVKGE